MGPWSCVPQTYGSILERKTPARHRIRAHGCAVRAGTTHHHAAALVAGDRDVATEHLRAVSHEFHSHAVAGISFIETPTVVLHGECQGTIGGGQLDTYLGYPPVPDRIGECLLRDPV